MLKIGFIGLGVMGAGMARNLLSSGYKVIVYNRTPGKADSLAAEGAAIATSPREIAKAADVIITMISNDSAIRDVYWGPNGVFTGISVGKILIDSSTISPTLAKELAATAAANGASFLDAPVTGSKPAADSGQLVFMVGGDKIILSKVEKILMSMGRKVIYMGDNGSGATAKLAHNTIVGINAVALAEGMAIAASSGINGSSFLDLVQSGAAASRTAELKGNKLLSGDYEVQFSLELMLKDLKLSSFLSDNLKVPTPMLDAAKNIFQIGEQMGYAELDMSSVGKAYEKWIGRKLSGQEQ